MLSVIRCILTNQYLILLFLQQEHRNDVEFKALCDYADIRRIRIEEAKEKLRFRKIKRNTI